MSKKVGILWGGGLGDLLVIRPFLQALQADPSVQSYLLTNATHMTELFEEFCSSTSVIQLPRQYSQLLRIIKKWHYSFDLIYLGPYPTFKTRLLGHILSPKKLWSVHHKNCSPYILDQVFADITALGLSAQTDHRDLTTFLPWQTERQDNPFLGKPSFLVIHPGAKQKWVTTRWSVEKWKALILKLLSETNYSLCMVGVKNEEGQLNDLVTFLPEKQKPRINLCVGKPLQNIAGIILGSSGVICHNSGIVHLSTFLQKKTVCITGSSGVYWQPHYPWVKNISSGLCSFACNCYKCPIPFFKGKCINRIETDAVWNEIINHFNIGQ
jgi:ADP-heptose:LPS heptosyltransferase